MFYSWGLRVEGADISPKMIERARANFGQLDALQWAVRGFDEPTAAEEPFDVAICVGQFIGPGPRHEHGRASHAADAIRGSPRRAHRGACAQPLAT